MSDQIQRALQGLDLRKFDCDYCDVRVEDSVVTSIAYKDFELQSCDIKPSLGCLIRVFRRGRWFYCSTTSLDRVEELINQLIHQSGHFAAADALRLPSPVEPYESHRITYADANPARVPASKKLQLCESYFEHLRQAPDLKEVRVIYQDGYKVKYFKSTRGVHYSYDYSQVGIRFNYTLREGEHIFEDQFMKFSDRFDAMAGLQSELIDSLHESRRFLTAKTITPGQYRVVLESPVVGVFAHESFGHKSEADFMLGDENAKREWKLGSRVGSPALSIVDDGTRLGTSGYCPFDDEGTPATKTYLIKEGILTGRLHSLHTSAVLDEAPTGNGRAINFEFEPIVRMTSTYVEPGTLSFDELIGRVPEGIYVKDMKYGTGLSTFTIAPRKSYWIRDGKIAEPVRVSVLSGSVFETLADVEACSEDFRLESSAHGGCGKGEQWPLPVSFGGPAMLVKRMQLS